MELKCPLCSSTKLKKWGKNIKKTVCKQRYKCDICGHLWIEHDRLGKEFVTVGIFSDLHCGHETGLTPKDYNNRDDEYTTFRAESWDWFSRLNEQIGRLDYAVFNGDLIDGSQKRSGGMELLVNNRHIQSEMAIAVIKKINALKNVIVRGTPYHVGSEENFEDIIAKQVGANIYDRFIGDIGGKIFDVRHKIGNTSIPQGKATAISRQLLWNRLRGEATGVKADIIVRSHVHTSIQVKDRGVLAFTTPALQGRSSYGSKECDGEVDYGFIKLDVYRDGRILVHDYIADLETNKIKVEII